jgi:hypothetical protein
MIIPTVLQKQFVAPPVTPQFSIFTIYPGNHAIEHDDRN